MILLILGDLFFLRSIKDPRRPAKVAIILMDLFSRLCYTSVMKNATSKEVLSHIEKSRELFGGPHKHFVSDRGE